jgi:hypothetical protein
MAGESIASIGIGALECVALRSNAIFAACSSARKRRSVHALPSANTGRLTGYAARGFERISQGRIAYENINPARVGCA